MWVCSCSCMQEESYVNFHMKAFLSSSSARSPNAVPSFCILTPASPPLFLYLHLYLSISRTTPSPSHYCVLICLVDLSTSLLFHHCDLDLLVYFQDIAQVRMMCMTGSVCAADRFNNECLTGEPKLMWHPDWKHPDDAGS